MKSILKSRLVIATMFIAIALLVSCGKKSVAYQCPMKCEGEKTYSAPGKCAVCGMDLEGIEKDSTSQKQ